MAADFGSGHGRFLREWTWSAAFECGLYAKNVRADPTVLLAPAGGDLPAAEALSRQLADAFRSGGGRVDFHVLAASGSEGHWLAETESGVKAAAPELERAVKRSTKTR